MIHPRDGERGIALIMVLLVVTLLTILVMEFTYTVEVESHISRNSLNALQATYLARSGINILAGALIEDDDPTVDPGEDDKWRYFALGPCQNILENEISVPPTWKLCGRIVDESGKVNVNFSRPPAQSVVQKNQGQAQGQPTNECKPNTPGTASYCWRDVLVQLASGSGLDTNVLKDALDSYWASPPPPKLGQPALVVADEFDSLEDVAASFPALQDRSVFDGLRKHVTALRTAQTAAAQKKTLNINTVPANVLQAIFTVMEIDEGAVGDIIARRTEAPFKNPGEAFQSIDNKAGALQMFGVKSNLFRLEASAVVNGVGKTVRVLVRRDSIPPPKNSPDGTAGYRITFLDWQKESGVGAARDAAADEEQGLEAGGNSAKDQS